MCSIAFYGFNKLLNLKSCLETHSVNALNKKLKIIQINDIEKIGELLHPTL